DGRGELIRPLAVPVADEKIAALLRRPLIDRPVPQIHESFDARFETHAQAGTGLLRKSLRRARAGVAQFAVRSRSLRRNLAAGARARIHEPAISQALQRPLVHVTALALTYE